MILVNGEQQNTIAVTDRGLHYGDGLFETIEIIRGQPVFLTQHLARLEAGCHTLKIPFPSTALLMGEISQVSKNCTHGVLKLMLTRGSGGRGYRQPELIQTTRFIALHPYPQYPVNYATQGVDVRFCSTRLGLNATLAGLKHNNRLDQVLARAEWQDEFQEGLMLNLNEHVIEGTMTNLFVVKEGVLHTPELSLSGIVGIIRQIVLLLAEQQNILVQQSELQQDFVLAADELFLSNSVIGLWPIKSLENKAYPVGSVTRTIQRAFAAYKTRATQLC
ncbi:MAG: 4-amino-4-deoxychorismate lyase [Methyloprofundus sp.]|nr:MAG: 4-amino-4-deoxychorismate lyase [Methyloprofundus sp.]